MLYCRFLLQVLTSLIVFLLLAAPAQSSERDIDFSGVRNSRLAENIYYGKFYDVSRLTRPPHWLNVAFHQVYSDKCRAYLGKDFETLTTTLMWEETESFTEHTIYHRTDLPSADVRKKFVEAYRGSWPLVKQVQQLGFTHAAGENMGYDEELLSMVEPYKKDVAVLLQRYGCLDDHISRLADNLAAFVLEREPVHKGRFASAQVFRLVDACSSLLPKRPSQKVCRCIASAIVQAHDDGVINQLLDEGITLPKLYSHIVSQVGLTKRVNKCAESRG